MKSNPLNKGISMTLAEKEGIVKGLVAAGIDRKVIDAVFNTAAEGCTKADNCVHTHPCNNYFKVSPDAMANLQKAMAAKGINPRIIPGISKLL